MNGSVIFGAYYRSKGGYNSSVAESWIVSFTLLSLRWKTAGHT